MRRAVLDGPKKLPSILHLCGKQRLWVFVLTRIPQPNRVIVQGTPSASIIRSSGRRGMSLRGPSSAVSECIKDELAIVLSAFDGPSETFGSKMPFPRMKSSLMSTSAASPILTSRPGFADRGVHHCCGAKFGHVLSVVVCRSNRRISKV